MSKKEKFAVFYEKVDAQGKKIGKTINLGTANSDKEADEMYSHYKRTGKKLKQTPKKKPRISAKRKKQVKTTSAVIGKRAWKFLTAPPPKKKKSAFDFFNV